MLVSRPGERTVYVNSCPGGAGSPPICITPDVGATSTFDRVVVIDGGAAVEDGRPADLAAKKGRYASLLEAEHDVRVRLWEGASWRRWWLDDGRLREKGP